MDTDDEAKEDELDDDAMRHDTTRQGRRSTRRDNQLLDQTQLDNGLWGLHVTAVYMRGGDGGGTVR